MIVQPSCVQLLGAHVVVVEVLVVVGVAVVVVVFWHCVCDVSHDPSWPANAGGKQSQFGQLRLCKFQYVPFQLQMHVPVQPGGPLSVVVVLLKGAQG